MVLLMFVELSATGRKRENRDRFYSSRVTSWDPEPIKPAKSLWSTFSVCSFPRMMTLRSRLVLLAVGTLLLVTMLFFYFRAHLSSSSSSEHIFGVTEQPACYRYPKQQNFHKYAQSSSQYTIAIISDMDKSSKTEDKAWRAVLKTGVLTRDTNTGKYSVAWSDEQEVKSVLNEAGRAMELSDLTYFNSQLYTFDDRTGLVFTLDGKQAIPRHVLMEGNGHSTKGMKIEWATVKDSLLYVGSIGKEWTTPDGEILNHNPGWVKTIDVDGRVAVHDWNPHYEALRKATNTQFPGYLLHEAVRWNAALRRWFFLPRRVSKEAYNEVLDEERGSNLILSTDEFWGDIRASYIGPDIPTHGFSAFQFVPFRETEIVALKTEEYKDKISTFLTVFDLSGAVLMEEQHVGNVKYEGLEIL